MRIDDTLIDQWTADGDHFFFDVPEGWMQGRSTFGGLTAAIMAALGRRVVPEADRSLRVFSTQLLAPVVPGQLRGEVSVLRSGRNITFTDVRLAQGDAVVARATPVFAKALSDALDIPPPPKPEVTPAESLQPIPYIPGFMPEFTQHVDMRWAEGATPYSGSETAAFVGHCRYRVPLGGVAGLLALLDTWPAPSLGKASKPIPASTVSWTAHLLGVPADFEQWFTFQYETAVGQNGLHTVVGRLYAEDGTLLGWTEQLVAVFG
ncbi:MAG: thioesterase family protein [Myxococcota bacterium]